MSVTFPTTEVALVAVVAANGVSTDDLIQRLPRKIGQMHIFRLKLLDMRIDHHAHLGNGVGVVG